MYHCFRLTAGMDLKKEIESYAIKNNLSGVVLSCVGSLQHIKVRLAEGADFLEKTDHFEIVSLTGTLSKDGVHLHIAVSDANGQTLGGHLKDGCLVYTTAEICLLELQNITFSRVFDKETGYQELVIS